MSQGWNRGGGANMSPHPVHDWPKKPPVLIGLSTPISMKKWRENANEWKGKEIHAWQFLGKNKLEKLGQQGKSWWSVTGRRPSI